jgi:hypothetical protein
MDSRERRERGSWRYENQIIDLQAAPVAPAAGLKRINLAGIATTAPAAKAAKTYPELPDPDGQVAELVEGILETSDQVEALSGNLEILC